MDTRSKKRILRQKELKKAGNANNNPTTEEKKKGEEEKIPFLTDISNLDLTTIAKFGNAKSDKVIRFEPCRDNCKKLKITGMKGTKTSLLLGVLWSQRPLNPFSIGHYSLILN